MRARLRLRSGHRSLPTARAAVRRTLLGEHWSEEAVELVVLALSETLSNAVEHGSRRGDPVSVEIRASADRAEVRVVDRGRPGGSPPAAIPAAPPPSSERGRGLIIMDALADDLEFRPAGRGTEVRLGFGAPAPTAPRRPAGPCAVAIGGR